MERAGAIVGAIRHVSLSVEDMARKAWPAAVGPRLALRTRPSGVAGATLWVEVEDAIWERQLTALRGQILHNLVKVIGPGKIEYIRFRVGVPRRPPERALANSAASTDRQDEADKINDPVLRRIYKNSRSKATA